MLAVAGTSLAATINVPADYTTIQDAVDAASGGDVILVAPGTYTGTGDEVVSTDGKAITIKASGTPEETIIDGEGARRVVYCSSGEGPDTIIEGFTITGGSNSYGGGIYCSSSNPTITGCTISDNTANYSGGGIYCSGGSSPTISGCTISGNTANYGGGIHCDLNSSPTITDCTISGNTANYGGGIYCSGGSDHDDTPTLTDTVVCGNAPDQIYPVDGWTDNGGNTASDECPIRADGVVDEYDLQTLLGLWDTDDTAGDIDGDGTVGISDLLAMLVNWGPC